MRSLKLARGKYRGYCYRAAGSSSPIAVTSRYATRRVQAMRTTRRLVVRQTPLKECANCNRVATYRDLCFLHWEKRLGSILWDSSTSIGSDEVAAYD